MITYVPLVKSLVRGCTSWSKTIATPLIPAVKASAKALSMGSLPSSASIVHWLFAWAITEENAWEKGNESYHLKTNYTNNIAETDESPKQIHNRHKGNEITWNNMKQHEITWTHEIVWADMSDFLDNIKCFELHNQSELEHTKPHSHAHFWSNGQTFQQHDFKLHMLTWQSQKNK